MFRSWDDIVQAGLFLRKGCCAEAMEKTMRELEQTEKQEIRGKVEDQVMKPFGVVGRMGLCDLEMLEKPCDVLMGLVHLLLLWDSVEAFKVRLECTGSGEDSADWNQKDHWPELFPPGWICASPRSFMFRYAIKELIGCKDAAKVAASADMKFYVKGMLMGSNSLVLSGLMESSETEEETLFSVTLNIKDFVANSKDPNAVKDALNSSLGLSGIVTRASSLHLATLIRDQMLKPMLQKFKGDDDEAGGSSGVAARSSNRISSDRSLQDSPRNVNIRDQDLGHGGARLGGHDDLIPRGLPGNNGHGGMFFGPGNDYFDSQVGAGRFGPGHPGGVPPGARFDPFGPPGLGSRGGGRGPMPRNPRGPPPGQFFGEPNPDHLRPPGGFGFHDDDNMYM